MLTTAQKAYNDFLASQASPTYNFAGMTDAEKQVEMTTYTALKIAAQQETKKNEEFIISRNAAFASLESEYNAKRTALQAEWQSKEDALV